MAEIQVKNIAGVSVISLSGRMDFNTAGHFQEQLLDALEIAVANKSSVVLNFQDVPYMSSAGLAVLIKAHKKCKETNVTIVISDLNALLSEVFQISRFDRIFRVFPSETQALEAIKG